MNPSQRLWSILPFLMALAVLVFFSWSVNQAILNPYDGVISMYPTGMIKELDTQGPTGDVLAEGDIILAIDGVPVLDAQPPYPGKRAGDLATLDILRDGQHQVVTFQLSEPSSDETVTRLAPLFVALIFWLIGVGVQTFKPTTEANTLFFLFFQITALLLTAGVVTFIGPAWTSPMGAFLLWIIGPLWVHFHLHFPQTTSIPFRRYLVSFLYLIGIAGGLPYLLVSIQSIQANRYYDAYVLASRIFLAVNFLIVVALLIYAYRTANSPGVRGKIRIVVLGGVLSLLPPVMLTILPDALLHQPILPYTWFFLVLVILPLTYGYAIFRHRLIEIERHVNRSATFILVYSILGGFYLLLYYGIDRLLSPGLEETPLINTILVVILASIFVPLRQSVQQFVDNIFYGGWYDYRSAVINITQGLEQFTELRPLARLIGERLVKVLRMQDACIFLKNHEGDFVVFEVAPSEMFNETRTEEIGALPRSSLEYLLKIGHMERSSLRKALEGVQLTLEEHQLLNTEQVHLWVPIIGHGQVQGLMALGPKFGGDIFSSEDLDILRVVAQQIGPVIENIHLVIRLRQYASELRQYADELEARVNERTAELHEQKERAEAVLTSVGDGVVVTDLNGAIESLNFAFEEQTGFSETELLGTNLLEYLDHPGNEAVLMEMRKALEFGEIWRGDLVAQRKDGQFYDIQLTLAPVRDENGNIVSYVGSQRDITRQKELDRMKDQFVSDVSHELRTPTTNISLYLELLQNAPKEKISSYLSILNEQGRQLRKLVEDILDLSRLTTKRVKQGEFTTVDLNTLAAQVVISHRPMADAAGLRLEFYPDKDLPLIYGQENQLTRVVTNLVANAVRYTQKGTIIVRTYLADNRVCLEVEDTGIGIEPEDQPHLFERFYRGKQVRQSRIHGTGLGLAIVKEILELHSGTIDVASEPGKGSIFTVHLPPNFPMPVTPEI